MSYRHVVLFKLHDGADAPAAVAALEAARPRSGASRWVITPSLDDRKGTVIVEDATFADEEAFDAWRKSALHLAAVAHMRANADWLVGDWVE
ncbi:Dabb family protein [Nocardioides sp.]|uniref:Dabb family protein n=1 Tax=Nocardioides sp. TaxID=35761 RepID=UPI002CF3AEC4|nr:Dabb family protein [Nocardioides sp.]HSX67387.1 Dabb family protein [Nocardioides sp.]